MDLTQILLYTAVGLSVGTLSGLFGIGGGFILVPILLLLGVPIHTAVGTSLAMIFFTSLAGSYKHFTYKNIDLKRSLPLALIAVLMVQLGVVIGSLFTESGLTATFAALMLLTSAYFIYVHVSAQRFRKQLAEAAEKGEKVSLAESKVTMSDEKAILGLPKLIFMGSLVGLLSGIFGVGGGFILVPLLIVMGKMPIKSAIGNSLFVVMFASLAGAVHHYLLGNVDLSILPALAIGGILGGLFGAYLVKGVSGVKLKFAFNGLLLFSALFMTFNVFI
ncbi:MAG: putative membrane protein YfcA [Oceanicoccus sp.]|jgi:uncharacterized membrane protein YfcA